jgi:hypothetical protein
VAAGFAKNAEKSAFHINITSKRGDH